MLPAIGGVEPLRQRASGGELVPVQASRPEQATRPWTMASRPAEQNSLYSFSAHDSVPVLLGGARL